MMNDEIAADAQKRKTGVFRPESLGHFKQVAKDLAWILKRPLQSCQEDLARIYGYSSLHQLQEEMKVTGVEPGPFEPRFHVLDPDCRELVEANERRMASILFGVDLSPFREDSLAEDRHYLAFEIGVFMQASDQRDCARRIDDFLTLGLRGTIGGWPIGLRAWLAAGYTETLQLAPGWDAILTGGTKNRCHWADLVSLRRRAGIGRLQPAFAFHANLVETKRASSLRLYKFQEKVDEQEEGFIDSPEWESFLFMDWLEQRAARSSRTHTVEVTNESLCEFTRFPSSATAARCPPAQRLSDPVGVRESFAFEAFIAACKSETPDMGATTDAFETRMLNESTVLSALVEHDCEATAVAKSYGVFVKKMTVVMGNITKAGKQGRDSVVQPLIAAYCALVAPMDWQQSGLVVCGEDGWYFAHDAMMETDDSAALAFVEQLLPSLGMRSILEWVKHGESTWMTAEGKGPCSIWEVPRLECAKASVQDLKNFFQGTLGLWDDTNLPDGHGGWIRPLDLNVLDDFDNGVNKDGEYASFVYHPKAMVLNVPGSGAVWVMGKKKNGKTVDWQIAKRYGAATITPEGTELSQRLKSATQELGIDVVIYDSEAEGRS